jgi:polar amino acid transport system substrate-binding protein
MFSARRSASMRLAFLLPCLLAAALPCARAEPVQLYVMDVPPIAIKAGPGKGVVGDIVIEAMQRAGMTPQLQSPPNNRAIVTVQLPASRDLLIIPLARVPEREQHFTWIAPLYKVERAFFTTGARIDSYAEARKALRSIAVARGTANLTILLSERIDPEKIYQINDNDNVPRLLLAGRMEAWFGPVEQMRGFLHHAEQRDKVLEGASVGSTENYLACSLQCDPRLVARITAQLAAMERDGTIHAIRSRYTTKIAARHR